MAGAAAVLLLRAARTAARIGRTREDVREAMVAAMSEVERWEVGGRGIVNVTVTGERR